MTARQLEQIRPWLDAHGAATDVGYAPAPALVRAGYVHRVVDQFWSVTEKALREAEQLRLRGRA